FFRTIKVGMSSDDVVKSCAQKKTNEMFLHRDALIARVDRMKAAGQCGAKATVADQKKLPDADTIKQCAEKLRRLKPHAPNEEWLRNEMARGEVSCDARGLPL